MKSSADKSKVMNLGDKDEKYKRRMVRKALLEVQEVKNLWIINNDLKFSKQSMTANQKANTVSLRETFLTKHQTSYLSFFFFRK